MIDEFNLIKKLQKFQSVKPNQEWVDFNKSQIIAKEFEKTKQASFQEIIFSIKSLVSVPRLASIYTAVALVVFSGFGIVIASKNAVPGDALYAVKQTEEKIRMAMTISPEQKTAAQMVQVSARLDELDIVSKQADNQEKKIVALEETKKAVVKATKEIASLSQSEQASLIGALASKIQEVEKTANAVIMEKDNPSFESIYKFLAESEIKEFEANEKNLTEKQISLLTQAKELFDVNKYSEALDLLYQIQPNNNIEEQDDSLETE